MKRFLKFLSTTMIFSFGALMLTACGQVKQIEVSGVELTNYDNLYNLDNINNVIKDLFKDE